MTDSATAQGTSPGENRPLDQAVRPGRVSADSFRMLTLRLKKREIVPTLNPAPVFSDAPMPAVPPPVVVAPAAPIETPKPVVEAANPIIVETIELPRVEEPPEAEAIVIAEPAVIEAPVETVALQPIAGPEVEAEIPAELAAEALPPPRTIEIPATEKLDVAERLRARKSERTNKLLRAKPEPILVETPSLRKTPQAQPANPAPPQTPEQDSESAELARSLLDMMAQGSAAGQPQERALAADTLLRMLPTLPLKSRVMLSTRLCLMEQPHHLLVAKLITDPDIAVAGPLLEDCSHLSDEDLQRVLAEGDPAKRRMMARRRKISRQITTALIETDDPSVLLTIARNAGAEITAEGFALLERAAGRRRELLAPMCIRQDLPVHFAFNLFWLAPPELRRYLLTRFLTDSETLTKILKIARGTNGTDASENTQADPQQVKLALGWAAGGDFDSAIETLADMSGLAQETILRILKDRQGDPLMALLKTLGFPRSQVQEEVDTLKGGLIDEARVTDDLQSLFDSLSFNKARILLTYWDWSSSGTGPYAVAQ